MKPSLGHPVEDSQLGCLVFCPSGAPHIRHGPPLPAWEVVHLPLPPIGEEAPATRMHYDVTRKVALKAPSCRLTFLRYDRKTLDALADENSTRRSAFFIPETAKARIVGYKDRGIDGRKSASIIIMYYQVVDFDEKKRLACDDLAMKLLLCLLDHVFQWRGRVLKIAANVAFTRLTHNARHQSRECRSK